MVYIKLNRNIKELTIALPDSPQEPPLMQYKAGAKNDVDLAVESVCGSGTTWLRKILGV